jgi:hypothetical protein
MFFETEEKKGGPTAVIYGFESSFASLPESVDREETYTRHPLFRILNKDHLNNIKRVNYDKEHPGEYPQVETQPEDPKADGKPKNKRQQTCDEIFAEYLGFLAKKVNKTYYSKVLKFVLFFRECTNLNSGKLKEESKLMPKDLFPLMTGNSDEFQTKWGTIQDYCATHNAEQLPDISNEFILEFIPDNMQDIEIGEVTDLTQHFCHWLFINGYTCAKLSLIE